MLTTHLNRIYTTRDPSATAAAVALELPADLVWYVAALHLAGLLRQRYIVAISRHIGLVDFGAFSVRLRETSRSNADICYTDREISLLADGIHITAHDGPSNLSDMLRVLQYARDRSDTLVYLPRNMRTARLERLAKGCNAGSSFVRFITANAPSLLAMPPS